MGLLVDDALEVAPVIVVRVADPLVLCASVNGRMETASKRIRSRDMFRVAIVRASVVRS